VIAYRELRKLELDVLRASYDSGQQVLDVHQLIGVNVDQFYGIEIEEFPAQIAQVALWLMDHQMNMRVSEEFGLYFARIPLKSTPHIHHANALTLDWNAVLPAERASFVFGNPPFIGKTYQTEQQKADMELVVRGIKNAGLLDFVAAWYVKAANYMNSVRAEPVEAMQGPSTGRTGVRCAFVSTNSITQGEQVGILWGWLLGQGMHIHFAHRTFQWSNEAKGKAAVHCVIIGFGAFDVDRKTIFEYAEMGIPLTHVKFYWTVFAKTHHAAPPQDLNASPAKWLFAALEARPVFRITGATCVKGIPIYADIQGEPHAIPANNINPYLVDAPDILLESRTRPISDVPEMVYGNKPVDGGYLLLSPEEKAELLYKNPQAEKWIRPLLGAEEFLNGKERWCLWLVGISPNELRAMPEVLKRVEAVREFRLHSPKKQTQERAATATLFVENRQPEGGYILVPRVSSERRAFVPMGFLAGHTICTDLNNMIPRATLYHFGVLSSTMHNAWVRYVCGRLKSDYRYSNTIVYNNFPWPEIQIPPSPALYP